MVALCFAPLRLLGMDAACVVWYLINTSLIVVLWRSLRRMCGPLRVPGDLAFFLLIGVTLERELHVGNINLLGLVIALKASSEALRRRVWPTSAATLSTAIIKPNFALLVLPIVGRLPRVVVPMAALGALFILVPLPRYGFTGTLSLYAEYLRSALEFVDSYADTFKFNSTTAGLLGQLSIRMGGPPLQGLAAATVNLGAALGVALIAKLRFGWSLLTMVLTLAVAPVSAASDYQVFLLAAPLVYVLLSEWPHWIRRPLSGSLVALALLAYGCNWHDLWGDRISDTLLQVGLHGLGTWGMVAATLLSRPRKPISTPR